MPRTFPHETPENRLLEAGESSAGQGVFVRRQIQSSAGREQTIVSGPPPKQRIVNQFVFIWQRHKSRTFELPGETAPCHFGMRGAGTLV